MRQALQFRYFQETLSPQTASWGNCQPVRLASKEIFLQGIGLTSGAHLLSSQAFEMFSLKFIKCGGSMILAQFGRVELGQNDFWTIAAKHWQRQSNRRRSLRPSEKNMRKRLENHRCLSVKTKTPIFQILKISFLASANDTGITWCTFIVVPGYRNRSFLSTDDPSCAPDKGSWPLRWRRAVLTASELLINPIDNSMPWASPCSCDNKTTTEFQCPVLRCTARAEPLQDPQEMAPRCPHWTKGLPVTTLAWTCTEIW